jgi:hypothetical protein
MTYYSGPGPWGPGEGQPLSQGEFDGNNYGFENRITDLETNPPQPNDIVGITLTGSFLSMTQRDGTILGPVPFSPPMARWRSEWAATTALCRIRFRHRDRQWPLRRPARSYERADVRRQRDGH